MRKTTIPQPMDLFVLLKQMVYPTLEESLDQIFPEFKFRKASHGWWVAQDAPMHYRDYGHIEGKLVARGWGFRSLKPGFPPVFWLGYINRHEFPKNPQLLDAVRTLAQRVRVVFNWSVPEEEIQKAQEKIRRHLLLETVLVHAQSEFWSLEGKAARKHLVEKRGIPENQLLPLEFGYISTSSGVRKALHQVGFDSTFDDERAGATGIYQPHWQERIVGPWRDRLGKTVFNLWGMRFPFLNGNEPWVDYLRRIDANSAVGSRDVPLQLHFAVRRKERNLLLVTSPMSAICPYVKGLNNPCPIASGGDLTPEQVEVLEKFLKGGGTLTLNLDFEPNDRDGVHSSTYAALDLMRSVSFPIYVVDPVRMQMAGEEGENVDPETFVRAKGMNAYIELLKTREQADRWTPLKPEEDEGSIFGD